MLVEVLLGQYLGKTSRVPMITVFFYLHCFSEKNLLLGLLDIKNAYGKEPILNFVFILYFNMFNKIYHSVHKLNTISAFRSISPTMLLPRLTVLSQNHSLSNNLIDRLLRLWAQLFKINDVVS